MTLTGVDSWRWELKARDFVGVRTVKGILAALDEHGESENQQRMSNAVGLSDTWYDGSVHCGCKTGGPSMKPVLGPEELDRAAEDLP